MIRKILFPVDFSPSCTAMAAYVQRAAALCGATVSLVHVCDLASHSGFELYARPGNEIAEEHWNVAREKLEQFLAFIDNVIEEGLATLEKAQIHFYRSGRSP